jgi:hypothetical protein
MLSVGLELDRWLTADERSQNGRGAVTLGTLVSDHEGKVYMAVQLGTGGVTGAGYVVTIDQNFEAVMLTTALSAVGDQIGVALGAGADNDYGYVQVYGPASVRSEQDALANALLAGTTDAGQVDDAPATGLFIEGLAFRVATPAADGLNATAFLNWPRIQTRMEPEA